MHLSLLIAASTIISASSLHIEPVTCGVGSPSHSLPFCDPKLPVADRVADLVKRLTLNQRLDVFTGAGDVFMAPNSTLNLKMVWQGFEWDATCIHGLAPHTEATPPHTNVTVFPHAIALGATFDIGLIAEVSKATVAENLAVARLFYESTGGKYVTALLCDGGPLANSAHDPRWGRIAETYGECPYLISRMGVTATMNMQGPDAASGRAASLYTGQVTRHFLGYHMASDIHKPNMVVDRRELADAYLVPYRAFQVEASAEGLMCGYSEVNGIPSCAHPFLRDVVRNEWGSDCIIQSDCCDSITSIHDMFFYTKDVAGAVELAVNAGTQLAFSRSGNLAVIKQAFQQLLSDGRVPESDLDSAVARILRTRFKLGEFEETPRFVTAPTDPLDSAPHRALARRTAAASAVLLVNEGAVLPLSDNLKRIAVVGPFAHWTEPSRDNPYCHSYSGDPSRVTSYYDALQEWAKGKAEVRYEKGCDGTTRSNTSSIAKAVSVAEWAEATLVVLGLGATLEHESGDRTTLTLPTVQAQLLSALRTATRRLVLALVSAGPVALDGTEADAIVVAWYGGEEAGSGLVDVLFGSVSPSARLPLTVYPESYLSKVGPTRDFNLTSGVGRTYRYLLEEPLFRFGFGLSYSMFNYTDLVAEREGDGFLVTGAVRNVGDVDSDEVVQVYVSVPKRTFPTPLISLVAFDRIHLTGGESMMLRFVVGKEGLETAQPDGKRVVLPGVYLVSLGGRQPGDPRGHLVGNSLTVDLRID